MEKKLSSLVAENKARPVGMSMVDLKGTKHG